MSKTIRRLLIGVGILFGLLVILVAGFVLYFDVNRYKHQIESAVAKSTGMELKLNGKASLNVFPRARVRVKDVHLANRGSELFAANELEVTPRLLPFLLHREVIVDQVSLDRPQIRIEKSAKGRMNYEGEKKKQPVQPKSAAGRKGFGPGRIGSVSVKNAEVTYLDRGTGKSAQLGGVNLDLSEISWGAGGNGPQAAQELIKSVALRGKFHARSLKAGTLVASNLSADIRDDHGLIQLDPTQASLFGGTLHGNAQIDLRSPTPKMKIAQTATRMDLSQLMPGGKSRVAGAADATLNLSASGKDSRSVIQSANGNATLHGQGIELIGVDVDAVASQLKGAQGMDLAKIGSTFMAAPLGPMLGQSAGVAAGGEPGQKTVIRKLVSDWQIHQGIAQAKDVAFSTPKTTVAFQGKLNLVKRTYQDAQLATVDPKGCAKYKVAIEGPLNKPRPTTRSIGEQLSKSYLGSKGGGQDKESMASGIAGILGATPKEAPKPGPHAPGKEAPSGCDHFYSGTAIQSG